MATALIGLGSNLGDRAANLNAALERLRKTLGIRDVVASSYHVTQPIGGPAGQPDFLNGAAVFQTSLSPAQLLARLQAIENELGRVREVHWGPRTIDLDILLYDDLVRETPELIIPHPRFALRRFVLVPAAEIAPNLQHPTLRLSIAELAGIRSGTNDMANPSSTKLILDPAEMQAGVRELQRAGKRVGVVPTMGALHEGHLSLAKRSLAECDFTVVTVFVNPTQFGPKEDFSKYPRTLPEDLKLLEPLGVQAVFAPTGEAMYPEGFSTLVEAPAAAVPLEGVCRPGHFRGVCTVVLKLLNIIPADVAYFGRKDYQQALVIRRMAADLNLPTRIEVCPAVRETDGLAISSRNRYLSPDERKQALAISLALAKAKSLVEQGERNGQVIQSILRDALCAAGIERIDYAAVCHGDTLEEMTTLAAPAVALIAAFVGQTRLIDNETLLS